MGRSEGVVVIFAAVLVILLSQRWLRDALLEAIDNFRGGPPTAMHPSPSNDGALLRKALWKTKDYNPTSWT
jgi:hypothetical protein